MMLRTSRNLGNSPHSVGHGFRQLRRIAAAGFLTITCAVASANQAPVVDSFTATASTVSPGDTVTLNVTANDPDCSDTCASGCGQYLRSDLTHWFSSNGTITLEDNGVSGSPYVAMAQWQAPLIEASYSIEVNLSDSGTFLCGGRQSATASITILVTSSSNQAPVVESVTAEPQQIFPGETSQIQCVASDPDGDPLIYSWSTNFGILNTVSGTTVDLTSDEPGVATVTCTATDNSGAPGVGSTVISISDVTAQRMISDGLASPHRVAVDSLGTLFAVDRSSEGISAIRLEDGRFMYQIPASGVTAVEVDWADRLLVGTTRGAIVLGRDGTPIRRLDFGSGEEISDVAVDVSRHLWVILQRHNSRVVVWDETGSIEAEFGTTGDGLDQLRSPSGIAVMPDGRIVVADRGHQSIKVFNIDGTLSLVVGGSGSGAGEFVEIDDIAVDSRGVIWASDSFQDWVQSFGPDGSLREIVGTYGDGVGQFKTAAGITVAEDFGSLVVASVNSSAVQVYQLGSQEPVDWPTAVPSTSPQSLTFAAQAVGTSSASLGLDVLNTGTGTLGVSGIEVLGPFVVTGGCSVVEPGGGCTFDVIFSPQNPGDHVGELRLHSSSSTDPHRIPLIGTAYIPAMLRLDQQHLDFGQQGVATTSVEKTVVLNNPGTLPLHFSQIAVDGPFGATSYCGGTVAGGSSCVLRVDFRPTFPGPSSGALLIESDALDSPHQIALVGLGETLELSLLPQSIDFGSIEHGRTSPTESIQVVNTGTVGVAAEEFYLDGPNPDDFDVTTDQCSGNRIDRDQSCWLQVNFTPSGPGQRRARLVIPIAEGLLFFAELIGSEISIFTDSFESGDTRFWASTQTAKIVHVSPDSIRFGQVEFGTFPDVRVVTLTNDTGRSVWFGDLSIVGKHPAKFVIDEDNCSSVRLEIADSCWFSVNLLTHSEGNFNAIVEVPASTFDETPPPDPVFLEGSVWVP